LNEIKKYRKKKKLIVIFSLLLLVASAVFVVFYSADEFVIYHIRLPRVLASIVVGAMLGVSGAVMQGVLKNYLASPFTLGISHGALFGVSVSLVLLDGKFLFLSAFLGGMGVILLIFVLSLKIFSKESVILCGIAISSVFASLSMFLQYFANDIQLSHIINWSFGDLSKANYESIKICAAVLVGGLLYFYIKRWDFNALEIEESENVGVSVKKLSIISLFLATLLSTLSVSYFGIIGFIGLIAPHFARLILGGSYEYLFFMSAILGAFLLMISDFIARVIIYPIEIPVGIVTAFLGGIVFLYLVVRKKNDY
jgi:iron complex transport system permease protein